MIYKVDTLPIYHFYTALGGDMSILECENAEDFLNEVIEKFNKITGREQTAELNTRVQIIRLRCKYIVCNNALEILRHIQDETAINILKSHGFNYDIENKIESTESILAQLQALLTNINFKTSQLTKDDDEEKEINMYEIVIPVEKQMGFTIDVQTTPIIKFATYIKTLKDGNKGGN